MKELWNWCWVSRFRTSPSQKTGIEIPIRAMIMSNGSHSVPFSTAAPTPIRTASTTQITAAPKTSESVAGIAATISGTTDWPWFEYETRSRLMKSFFIMIRYRIGTGRSSPNWWRISFTAEAEGFRPAIWRAGSTPGVSKKMRKTSRVITNITSTVHSRRRMMNVANAYAPTRSLGERVERVADAVAEHVQRQHGEHDHDAGRDRDPRAGVEEMVAVVDDRATTRVLR